MYFYAALFFCWRLQNVSASNQWGQVSHVRTRPRLASRAGPFDEGWRPNNQPQVDGGASGRRPPVNQQGNAGFDDGYSQPGSLSDLTQQYRNPGESAVRRMGVKWVMATGQERTLSLHMAIRGSHP